MRTNSSGIITLDVMSGGVERVNGGGALGLAERGVSRGCLSSKTPSHTRNPFHSCRVWLAGNLAPILSQVTYQSPFFGV